MPPFNFRKIQTCLIDIKILLKELPQELHKINLFTENQIIPVIAIGNFLPLISLSGKTSANKAKPEVKFAEDAAPFQVERKKVP